MVKNIILISIAFFISSCSENGVEKETEISGCMDILSENYNSSATIDDGSCIYSGCTDAYAFNYDSTATSDDGNCLYNVECGDVNIDLSIDIFDIIIMVEMILSNNYNYISDMNLDNQIDIIDIFEILNIILIH